MVSMMFFLNYKHVCAYIMVETFSSMTRSPVCHCLPISSKQGNSWMAKQLSRNDITGRASIGMCHSLALSRNWPQDRGAKSNGNQLYKYRHHLHNFLTQLIITTGKEKKTQTPVFNLPEPT